MLPDTLNKISIQWGPGLLLLLVFAYGFMRLAVRWIDKQMELKKEQTERAFDIAKHYVSQLAGAQSSQAEAIARLASAAEQRDSRESYEHQEMLVALKAIHRNVLASTGSGKAIVELKD